MRRQQSKSHFFSRYLRIILFAFFVSGIAALLAIAAQKTWVWMQNPTAFPIKTIQIVGELTHVPPQQIQAITKTHLSGGFFSLQINSAKQAILALPWIADVSFRRVWPGQLDVYITEQKPVARFGKNGVLNADNVIFYPNANSIPDSLPTFYGEANQTALLLSYYQALNVLAQQLNLTVESLRVNTEQAWQLELSNPLRVQLGRTDALDRFRRFVAAYPKISAQSQKTMVSADLRYPDGIAVAYQ